MASGNVYESASKTSTDDLELFEELAITPKLSQRLPSWARDSSSNSSCVDASRKLSSEKVDQMKQVAEYGYVEILRDMLEHDPSCVNVKLNYEHKSYCTPLHVSAYYGHVNVMKLLLEYNADIQAVGSVGDTPLHSAATGKGGFVAVKVLIERGADIHVTTNAGDTPLHYAARWGGFDVFKVLTEHGADIHVTNKKGETPLLMAVSRGESSVVKYLINQYKVDITELHQVLQKVDLMKQAAEYGNVEILRDMLEHDPSCANVKFNYEHVGYCTPLHVSAYHGHVNVMKLLLDYNADIQAVDSVGDTPLHDAAGKGGFAAVKVLIERGADIHVTTNAGDTPLHYAARWGGFDAFKVLTEHGADIHVTNKKGETPLLTAISRGESSVVKYLINQYKVDITELDQKTQQKINELLEAESSSDSASSVTVDDGENTPTESASGTDALTKPLTDHQTQQQSHNTAASVTNMSVKSSTDDETSKQSHHTNTP